MRPVIRPATLDEHDQIKAIFDGQGGVFPDQAKFIVAIDDQGIAGFWTVQPVIHAGPLWIREDKRRTGLWRDLGAGVAEVFEKHDRSGFYSFSDGDRTDHMFAELGYRDLGYRVWAKEVI